MFFDILTLFPGMFDGVFTDSIIKRAVEKGLISIDVHNIRDYAEGRHSTVDDYPYGGDPGMLLKPEPGARAIKAAGDRHGGVDAKVVFLTPQGRPLTQQLACELSREPGLILVCGRYKGLDQRVRDTLVDLEVSIGDYVLSGGEIPAMVVVDTVTRLIPGVLGNSESAKRDSHFAGLLSPPHYTRPEVFEGQEVPPVLVSGNHQAIADWQREQAEKMTRERRPDLWEAYVNRDKDIR